MDDGFSGDVVLFAVEEECVIAEGVEDADGGGGGEGCVVEGAEGEEGGAWVGVAAEGEGMEGDGGGGEGEEAVGGEVDGGAGAGGVVVVEEVGGAGSLTKSLFAVAGSAEAMALVGT